MSQKEIQITHTKTPKCDGEGGALGHPLIYLKLDRDGKAECPYCDRIFVTQDYDTKTGT